MNKCFGITWVFNEGVNFEENGQKSRKTNIINGFENFLKATIKFTDITPKNEIIDLWDISSKSSFYKSNEKQKIVTFRIRACNKLLDKYNLLEGN